MTDSQRTTRANWRKAQKAYRDAPKGFRATTRKVLEAAVINVLRADTTARLEARERRIAA